MDTENIIFLDVDGVLNTTRTCIANRGYKYRENEIYHKELDPIGAGILMRVLDEFDAKIVVSSVWRLGSVLENGPGTEHLLFNNFDELGLIPYLYKPDTNQWRTKLIQNHIRGTEVDMWLKDHGQNIKNYVIIDDDIDFLEHHRSHFVKTDANVGLTYKSYVRMTDIFKNIEKRMIDFPLFET